MRVHVRVTEGEKERTQVFEGVVIRPSGFEDGTRYPLVVIVHGGPESQFLDGWINSYSRPGHALAERGFVLLPWTPPSHPPDATHDVEPGDSGGGLFDGRGRLIGINFDRNWEGTMSDVHYDPDLCRNITVDVRYILFIIDKFAGATYLIDEMDIAW